MSQYRDSLMLVEEERGRRMKKDEEEFENNF